MFFNAHIWSRCYYFSAFMWSLNHIKGSTAWWIKHYLGLVPPSTHPPPILRPSAHLPVQVGHSVGLDEPPSPTADERPRARRHTRAVVSGRLLVLGVGALCHPTTEEETHTLNNQQDKGKLKGRLKQLPSTVSFSATGSGVGRRPSVPADDAVHRGHALTFQRANVRLDEVGGACVLRLLRANVLC